MRGGAGQGFRKTEVATGLTAILAAGSPPSHRAALETLRTAERLVACDGAWRTAASLGRNPDAVVGDGDSLGADGLSSLASLGIPFVRMAGQDTNDLSKAFSYALESSRDGDRVAIVGATGMREDHSLGNIFRLVDFAVMHSSRCGFQERGEPGLSMVTDHGRFEPVMPPGRAWNVPAGHPVSVFAPVPGTKLSSNGLEWPIDCVDSDCLWRGTLNRAATGCFSVSTDKPAIVYIPHAS